MLRSVNLVAPDGPSGPGRAGEQFKVRSRADRFDHLSHLGGLLAVSGSPKLRPTPPVVPKERRSSTNTEEKELVRDAPVVPNTKLRLYPNEAASVLKAPGLQNATRLEEKGIRRPEMEMGLVVHKL